MNLLQIKRKLFCRQKKEKKTNQFCVYTAKLTNYPEFSEF